MTKQEAANAIRSMLGIETCIENLQLDVDGDWLADLTDTETGIKTGTASLPDHGYCDPIIIWLG